MRHICRMLGENRHQAKGQRQLLILRIRKIETNVLRAENIHMLDHGIGQTLLRAPLSRKQVEAEQHVLRGQRMPIREMGFRIEMKQNETARSIGFITFSNQPVKRERLVERAHHQGLKHIAIQPLCGGARLEIERVEAVKCALQAKLDFSALGRIGIGIGQGRHACKSRLPVHGQRGEACGGRG